MKKMKKLLLLFAVIVTALVCFALSASALDATGQCGDNVYWEYNSTTGELVISGEGAMTDYKLVYNDAYEAMTDSPFFYSDIKSVVINNGVTTIGDYAFSACDGLTSITIPDSVTTIGDDAFSSCDSLTEVTIPDSVTTIGDDAFSSCYSLTEVTIPGGVTTIGDYAFAWCDSLTEVTIPDSVTTIGDGAFYMCESLTSVTIPDGVTTICNSVFGHCVSLTSITIPDSVTTIDFAAFAYCDSLTDVYYVGTQEQWKKINIGSENSALTDANIIYNYCAHKDKTVYPQQNATCTEIGYTTGTYCPDCEKWLEGHRIIHATNHANKVLRSQQNATCTENGYDEGVYCLDCGMWLYGHEIIPATNHANKVLRSQKNATCTKNGYTEGTYCPDCKKWLEGHEIIPATKHANKVLHSQQNATCTVSGYTEGTYCPDCEKWLEGHRIIPAINHANKVLRSQQNATCTENGYTEGIYCLDCKNWLDGHNVIESKGHIYTEKVIDSAHLKSAATAENAAVYKYDCAVCDSISPDKTFTYGDALTLGNTIVQGSALKLGATTSLTATQTTSSLTLTWSKAANATGYRLYYRLPGDTNWRNAVTYTTATTCTLNKLPAGQKYTFAVRSAYKKADGSYILGGYKAIETATKAVNPKEITVTQNTAAIRLSWNLCVGATGYKVYQKVDGEWKALKVVASTTYTIQGLKAGTKYTFAVKPYIKTDSGNIWSSYTEFTTATKPATPSTKLTSPSKGNISLTFGAVNGADGYRVYYKTGNGAYKLYNTYTKAGTLNFSNLKSGTKYTFAVRAGIKTSGGVVWGGYNIAAVTVK